MSNKPAVGRVVLFTPGEAEKTPNSSAYEYPAIITRVWSDICVNLQVLRDADTPIFVTSVEADRDCRDRTWRWPERN